MPHKLSLNHSSPFRAMYLFSLKQILIIRRSKSTISIFLVKEKNITVIGIQCYNWKSILYHLILIIIWSVKQQQHSWLVNLKWWTELQGKARGRKPQEAGICTLSQVTDLLFPILCRKYVVLILKPKASALLNSTHNSFLFCVYCLLHYVMDLVCLTWGHVWHRIEESWKWTLDCSFCGHLLKCLLWNSTGMRFRI